MCTHMKVIGGYRSLCTFHWKVSWIRIWSTSMRVMRVFANKVGCESKDFCVCQNALRFLGIAFVAPPTKICTEHRSWYLVHSASTDSTLLLGCFIDLAALQPCLFLLWLIQLYLAPRIANFAKISRLENVIFLAHNFLYYLNPIEFSKGSKGFRVWIKKSKQLIPTEKNKIDKSGTWTHAPFETRM